MTMQWSERTLENRLRVVALEAPGAPLVEVRLLIPFAHLDGPDLAAQVLTASCFGTGVLPGDGRPGRSRQGIADAAADMGAELSAVVTAETLVVSAVGLEGELPALLELLSDLLVRPHYRVEALDTAQQDALGAPATPGPVTRARRATLLHGFGRHPLSSGAAGLSPSPTSAMKCTVADLQRMHVRAIVPEGSLLFVQGPADPDHALKLAAGAMEPWSGPASGLVFPEFGRTVPQPGRVSVTAQQPTGTEAHLFAVGPGLSSLHPDQAALHLALTVLGGTSSSRLHAHLRDDLGLAYAPRAEARDTRAGSWTEITAVGAPESSERLAEALERCTDSLASSGPTPGELEIARQHALGFTRFALATRAETASALAGFAAAGMPLDWLAHFRHALETVPPEEVAEAARLHLAPEVLVVSTLEA